MAIHGKHPAPLNTAAARKNSRKDPNFFGYIFPKLPPFTANDAALEALAKTMVESPAADLDSTIPAGITYLGQFLDHDITLDLSPLENIGTDATDKRNFRSPSLDLDSLYGLGPGGSPHMYERDPNSGALTARLIVGDTENSPDLAKPDAPVLKAIPSHDLPRSPVTGLAIIGDPRNDENLLVAQTHVAFMRFHNRVVDQQKGKIPDSKLFETARRIVVWHYQWIILHEFLEALTGEKGITARILREGRKFYRFEEMDRTYMPLEFSTAAYRLGHSMVRQAYSHNRVFNPAGIHADFPLLFHFTAKSGRILGELAGKIPPDGTGAPNTQVLPSNWIIDWRRFFPFEGTDAAPAEDFNFARRIDPLLVQALHELPGTNPVKPNEGMLAFLNLKRGVLNELASGQAIAKAMGITPLTPNEIATGPDGAEARKQGFDKQTPLWYYILKEAQVKGNGGQHLGPVGKMIIAETLIGLVAGSRTSYLSAPGGFTPDLGKIPGRFTMADMLSFTFIHDGKNDLNPVG